MRARAALLLVALLAGAASGCLGFGGDDDPRAGLVAYPRLGDVATYEATGAHLDLGRWENGHPFVSPTATLRITLAPSGKVLDAARAVHPAFKVTTERSETGPFLLASEKLVSPAMQAVVQARYPLSQDQSTLSFDERGYPWLFGASALFGADLAEEREVAFALPDNLGRGVEVPLAWRVAGTERVEGVDATRLVLEGAPGLEATLWMEPGSAWPVRVSMRFTSAELAPHVRVDGALPVSMEARRVEVKPGDAPLPGRDRGATFPDETGLQRAPFDGEKPPDGASDYVPYLLADAVRDVRLLDRGLAGWLATADDPRLYRGTYIEAPAPAQGFRNQTWLLAYMDKADRYYTVQVYRLDSTLLGLGVPLLNNSGPSEPPRDPNHGWFPASAVAQDLVPLSEGVRLVRDTFGAQRVEIFLRSFADPPGYSYYIDGGFEGAGRYTVVVNPTTGLIENATGPVTPRMVEA
jgi:hypothetical protein